MLADRRILLRSEFAMPNAVRLLEELPPQDLPKELTKLAQEAAGCRVGLYVPDIGGSVLRLVAGEGWPAEIELTQSLGVELTRGRLGELQEHVAVELDGVFAVPLWLHGSAPAVLLCEQRPAPALEPFARQAAAAIVLADSYTDELHRARRRQPTSPAAELQENLLPPRFATLAGAEVAGGIVPAYDVGGDWFDHAQNAEGAWLAVADAAGKGPKSAGVSSVALGAFRAARRSGADLCEAAFAIDEAIASLHEVTFVTAVLATFDAPRGEVRWLRFGHPWPYVVRADGTMTFLRVPGHLPLGLLGDDVSLQPEILKLGPGDRFVLYSDGVSERRTADGGFFLEDGITATLASVTKPGAAPLAHTLVQAVVDASPEPPRDDATVLVLAVDD